jgi:hypothetical protein
MMIQCEGKLQMCQMFPRRMLEPVNMPRNIPGWFCLERPVRIRRCWENGGDFPMTFNPVSYAAGVGTVFVAVAIGFGGGLLITRSDHRVDPPNRLERVTASAPPATAAVAPASSPAQPAPAVAAPAAEANASVAVAPVAAKAAEAAPPAPATQVTAATPQVTPQQSQATETTRTQNQPVRNQPASTDQPSSTREAFAKAQDQDVDMRRRSERSERRQAERERRKWKWMDRKRRQQDLDGAAEEVRNIDRPEERREVFGREIVQKEAGQRDIFDMPKLGFFGQQ